jgi:hypothetical protein
MFIRFLSPTHRKADFRRFKSNDLLPRDPSPLTGVQGGKIQDGHGVVISSRPQGAKAARLTQRNSALPGAWPGMFDPWARFFDTPPVLTPPLGRAARLC